MNTPERRDFIRAMLAGSVAAPWCALSLAGRADSDDARLVVVLLRGGMDGLSSVPLPNDAQFNAARGPLAAFAGAPLPLDATFALHPALVEMHGLYQRQELVALHAIGLPYRERSHFDAQQLLESGGQRPYELSTGWLGRALAAKGRKGLAVQTAVPLVLRGPGDVDTWAPSTLPDPSTDLVARVERLYAGDRALALALARAKALREGGPMPERDALSGAAAGGARTLAITLARRAGEFLLRPGGPQAAVLELGGWDTHANQASPQGALNNNLKLLDTSIMALRETLSAQPSGWARTVVVVITEFGREVAINGTLGTDHGTGGAAFVLGGAVRGGRVIADWPGLAPKDRFEGRDLRTTTDLRALLKGVLHDHLNVARATLDQAVFPGSAALAPLELLRG
jgi:uncharacterized protein (DUF1501 family)